MVQLINNKAYLPKDVIIGLGITTDRYLRNGKQKPDHWDIILHPKNKKLILLGYEALLEEHKNIVVQKLGNPYELVVRTPVLSMIKPNPEAYNHFATYTYNGGEKLPYKRILQYTRGEAVLSFINKHTKIQDIRKNFGMDGVDFYRHITNIIEQEKLRGQDLNYEGPEQLDGKFPASYAKLLKRSRDYAAADNGFSFFIHPSFGNSNSVKVTADTEDLLNDIYVLNHKPNYTEVHRIYSDFILGKHSIINAETGEVYDHTEYKAVGVSTVYGYVSAWENKSVTHKKRSSDKIGYNQAYRPYASLEVPQLAGSLISMDDRDLPFKTINNIRVKAYLAMDVASEAFIGYSFNATDKDMTLVMDCFRDMYKNLAAAGYNQPAEVEVEQHLMSTLKEGILNEGAVFPYVRFAQAANPQEKSIERAFRRMRYGLDKQIAGWIPRPFAKDEANQSRTEEDIKTAYTPDQVIQIATANIIEWNNQLHPNQKAFKGLTRLQVWHQKQNELLLPIRWQQIAKYLGHQTFSSINRGEIRAFNGLYVLDTMKETAHLENGQDLEIYGLEDQFGTITCIHIYKHGEFVLTANAKVRWQKARIEQTDADRQKIITQQKYTAAFDADVKERKSKLKKLAVIKNDHVTEALKAPAETMPEMPVPELMEKEDNQDYAAMAIANL